jgi:hypothetical protein
MVRGSESPPGPSGPSWTVDDPGGGESMLRYDVASKPADSEERRAARQWLLEYNHGDVTATWSVRRWLREHGNRVPSIESVLPAVVDHQEARNL